MNTVATGPSRVPWPPIVYIAALAVAIILAYLVPLPWITEPISDLLFAAGIILVLVAVAMIALAFQALKRASTTVRPDRPAEHLVTDGPFALTRNPLYLADTIALIGIGLIAGSAWFLILAIIAAFATQKLAIEREERHLDTRFGKKYRDYCRRVRRWI